MSVSCCHLREVMRPRGLVKLGRPHRAEADKAPLRSNALSPAEDGGSWFAGSTDPCRSCLQGHGARSLTSPARKVSRVGRKPWHD